MRHEIGEHIAWHEFAPGCTKYLALESKISRIDADELEVLLEFLATEDLQPHKRKTAYTRQGNVISSVGWDFQNRMIVRGAEMLASIRPDAKTRRQLQALEI